MNDTLNVCLPSAFYVQSQPHVLHNYPYNLVLQHFLQLNLPDLCPWRLDTLVQSPNFVQLVQQEEVLLACQKTNFNSFFVMNQKKKR